MSRLAKPDQNTLDQCEAALSQAQATMGYLPNDVLSLCHWPELLPSLSGLVQTILQSGQVDPTLKRLIGVISSHTQGCTYCTAHAGYGANQLGVEAEKIAAVFEFETSPLFSAAERAALRVAWHGALQPSAVTDDDIAALTTHFSQQEIVEIVAVLSLYGFLNRWNSTLDTELEAPPADFAQSLSALSKDAQR
jgi:uncharacterized peroxidase-related enzyme